MVRKKLNNKLYLTEQYYWNNRTHVLRTLPDGYLFSGSYPTKIKPSDLPEWYLYGRYYKKWGYMCTKGITDLVYIPSKYSNHFYRDDFLLISYHGKITDNGNEKAYIFERYGNYDESVYCHEIVTILKGARKYSGFDITPFIAALKDKLTWLCENYPEEFNLEDKSYAYIDKMFEEDD